MALRALTDGKMPVKCVPGRLAMARLRPDAFPGGNPWQFFHSMYPKGASDEKRGASWQDLRAMHPKRAGFGKMCAPCIRKAPQIAVGGYTARISCQEGALFAARAPRIMHGAQILPSVAAPNSASDRSHGATLMGGGTGRGRLLVGRGDAAKGVRGVVGCRALAAKLASVKLRLQVSDADNLAES